MLTLCTCRTTNTNGDTVNGLAGAVSIESKVTDNLMQKYMWLADTAGQVQQLFLLDVHLDFLPMPWWPWCC